MQKPIRAILFIAIFCLYGIPAWAQENVIDEVIWVVGDEVILKSQVEEVRRDMLYSGQRINGDPNCIIPEQIAIQKLFLTQAAIDSIVVEDARIFQQVEMRLNEYIRDFGSKEKVEEFAGSTLSQLREKMIENVRETETVRMMQQKLVEDVKVSPADVRRYFTKFPADSIPYIPEQVEVQIITVQPRIPQEETDNVKARLRDYTDRINKGESEFSTLAVLYSEDPGSASQGGELGLAGKAAYVPEFSEVAFNLNDPKKVSKIVQTEYGFHIIQLIERRGDRVNVRHILIKPKVEEKDKLQTLEKLDSLRTDIQNGKFTYEEAAEYISQDKTSRKNNGLMVNQRANKLTGEYETTTKFEMGDLQQDIAKVVSGLKVGEISKPFVYKDERKGEILAIVKLKSRTEGHKATVADDFQALKSIVQQEKQREVIEEWIKEKQKKIYVRIKDGWNNCEFVHDGWIR